MCPSGVNPNRDPKRDGLPTLRKTAKYHLVWRNLITYQGEYHRKRQPNATITVYSINRPPRLRTFRTSKGERQFTLTKLRKIKRKVIIVAKTKKRTKAVEVDELEELEGLEDLDEELEDLDEEEDEEVEKDEIVEDIADEDEDLDDNDDEEDDEDEDDEEEPPAKKRGRPKGSTANTKRSATRAQDKSKVGTTEVAEHFGVDSRTLRMVLRKHSIEKDPETKRYEWSSLKHPEVVKIGKLLAKGEAKRLRKEQLDNVKAKAEAKTPGAKKSTTKKKRKVVEEEDED